MRIVSLNQCLDSDPRRARAARSHRGDQSLLARPAALDRLPSSRSTCRSPTRSAEEIVALRPDLVLASRHSAIATRNALRRVGIRFELFDVAFTVADSLAQIRQIAALVGSHARRRSDGRPDRARDRAARLPPGTRRLDRRGLRTGRPDCGREHRHGRADADRRARQRRRALRHQDACADAAGAARRGAAGCACWSARFRPRHGTQAERHRAASRSAQAAFAALGVSGALHVLRRADDDRRSRRARPRTRRHPCAFSRRRPRDDNASLGHAVAARTRGCCSRSLSIAVGRIVLDWNVWLAQDAIGRTILLELRLPRALLGVAGRRSARARRRGDARLSAQSARRSRHARRLLDGGARRGAEHLLRRRRAASVGAAVVRRRRRDHSAWPRCSCSPA